MEDEDPHHSMHHPDDDMYPYLMDTFEAGMQSPLYNQDPGDLGPQSRNASPERFLDDYPAIENTCAGGKAGLPIFKQAVHKNRSAYNLFIKDRYSKRHYSRLKHKSTKDQMQILTKEWRELPPQERKKFEDLARQEKVKYENYKKSKLAKKTKKEMKSLPKSPVAPFTLFQMEERKHNPEVFKDMGIVDVTKVLSKKWKDLPAADKEKYQTLFSSEKKQYQKAVQTIKMQALKKEKARVQKKPVHQPFVGFIKARYGELHQAHPKLKHCDVIRLLSEEWKTMTKEEKDAFKPGAASQQEPLPTLEQPKN